jgi:hypothetical protein
MTVFNELTDRWRSTRGAIDRRPRRRIGTLRLERWATLDADPTWTILSGEQS